MESEQAHLAASRAALRAMRVNAESLETSSTTSWVNDQILRADLDKRIAALADLAETPLFFGRLDTVPDRSGESTRYYIGRRHVHDADGDPMVIDWRAPVSRPFYRASRQDPQSVALRRRFGYTGGELTAYEDERFAGDPGTDSPADADTPSAEGSSGETSALLRAEIERPRVGPMRDIVATIQPEQDEIVRAEVGETLCVQGAPGTGKTAVGLHRVAYLLYTHRERLARGGALILGPNDSFLRYIEQVLPALGEVRVRQSTVAELVAHVPVRGADTARAATVKGDARMAQLLRRAVRSGVRAPEEPLALVRGSRTWRVPVDELRGIVEELRADIDRWGDTRDMRYGAAREALPQRLAHAVLVRMERAGEAPDDRTQNAVARSAPVKAIVNFCWPAVDPAKLVLRLLSDADFLAEQSEGLLTPEEQRAVLWPKPARGVRSARWSAADAVLVDEATDLVSRLSSLGHVVLDEAQDLSPMEYRAVGRRCATGTATVLGDIAQGTTPWATRSWTDALTHLGKPGAEVTELTRGFRVPREVIAYASRLLPEIAPTLREATSVRESPGDFAVLRCPEGALTEAVHEAVRRALEREGSVGLIVSDARVPEWEGLLDGAGVPWLRPGEGTAPDVRLTLVPAGLAKGLEYDHVVLEEPAALVAAEPDERTGLRRLYVCLTRAVSGLLVVHAQPLPEALTAAS
nr:AAA family ATPase [Streptomyces sp. AJS327]